MNILKLFTYLQLAAAIGVGFGLFVAEFLFAPCAIVLAAIVLSLWIAGFIKSVGK